MGSLRKPRLSEMQVCLLYKMGAARDTVGRQAGMTDYEMVDCLRRNGVALRDDAESRAIAVRNREQWKSTMKSRQRRV